MKGPNVLPTLVLLTVAIVGCTSGGDAGRRASPSNTPGKTAAVDTSPRTLLVEGLPRRGQHY